MGRELPVPPPDAPTPFALADPERVRSILGAAGFDGVELESIDEPIELGTDASDALEFAKTMGIVEGLTDGLDSGARATRWPISPPCSVSGKRPKECSSAPPRGSSPPASVQWRRDGRVHVPAMRSPR